MKAIREKDLLNIVNIKFKSIVMTVKLSTDGNEWMASFEKKCAILNI